SCKLTMLDPLLSAETDVAGQSFGRAFNTGNPTSGRPRPTPVLLSVDMTTLPCWSYTVPMVAESRRGVSACWRTCSCSFLNFWLGVRGPGCFGIFGIKPPLHSLLHPCQCHTQTRSTRRGLHTASAWVCKRRRPCRYSTRRFDTAPR